MSAYRPCQRHPLKDLATVACLLLAAGCATTISDDGADPWPAATTAAPALPAAPIPVYVASFGLAPSLARRHPELTDGQVGWGVSHRIVEALYDDGRFVFREEKAEMARRLGDLAVTAPATGPDQGADVRWLLYGEVVNLRVSQNERVAGLRAKVEIETTVTIQIRLLDRTTGHYFPATGTATETRRKTSRHEIDPQAVAEATHLAVRKATATLLSG